MAPVDIVWIELVHGRKAGYQVVVDGRPRPSLSLTPSYLQDTCICIATTLTLYNHKLQERHMTANGGAWPLEKLLLISRLLERKDDEVTRRWRQYGSPHLARHLKRQHNARYEHTFRASLGG